MATYPSALITFPANTDNVTDVNAALVDLRDDEIEALEAELGLLPKGSYASVRARLDALPKPIASTTVAFTDGDTLRRVTVTDANVTASSKIVVSVRRPDTADDSADLGHLYIANVVEIVNGAFDVLIAALAWGIHDTVEKPPNETITLTYQVQN